MQSTKSLQKSLGVFCTCSHLSLKSWRWTRHFPFFLITQSKTLHTLNSSLLQEDCNETCSVSCLQLLMLYFKRNNFNNCPESSVETSENFKFYFGPKKILTWGQNHPTPYNLRLKVDPKESLRKGIPELEFCKQTYWMNTLE